MLYLNGIRVPHRKHTADGPAVRMTNVDVVTIPMQMHIGAPASPTVKVGDHVEIGTMIAQANGHISSPVYSGVSGTVLKISDMLTPSGNTIPTITIRSDGEMKVSDTLAAPVIETFEDLISAIRNSGVVGLGGAGFPPHVKFNVDPTLVEELIVNGAECEPYITSDSYIMTERFSDIEYALNTLKRFFRFKKIIIGIEGNKKRAIAVMKEMASRIEGCEVKVLPQVYPQGGEKVIVYHTTGKCIPQGELPIKVGCIVCNSTTVATLGSYFKTGMPLVEKCITVDGAAVKTSQNVIVPIGTSMQDVFAFCGGFTSEPAKVLYGGPMMGIAVPDLSAPIMKNTNAILALTEKEARLPKTTACIRCGTCTNTCPFGLAPASILLAYKKKDVEALEKLSVMSCMECGCCSFVCPANRPLVQTNKLSKLLIMEEKAKEERKNG